MISGPLFAVCVVVFWLLTIVAVILTWRWRNRPDRIARMADVAGPAMFLSPARYARIIPSLMLGAVGMSFGVVPSWWATVAGNGRIDGFTISDGDPIVIFLGLFGAVLMLASGPLAVLTALWRVPSILVFPFLREDSTDGERLDGDMLD